MSELMKPIAEWCAALTEAVGIAIIAGVAFHALLHGLYRLAGKGAGAETIVREVRQRLGRGILLGLEFLVAADIIHTVAVELTFGTVGVLAVVVLIRTFLSFTLDVELNGRWPWQQSSNPEPG